MNRTLCAVGFAALCATWTAPAAAGIADGPLPVLSAGATTFHLYSVPGVISSGGLRTYFSCNLDRHGNDARRRRALRRPRRRAGQRRRRDLAQCHRRSDGDIRDGTAAGISIDSNLLANKPLQLTIAVGRGRFAHSLWRLLLNVGTFSKGAPTPTPRRPGRKPGRAYGPRAWRPVPAHIDAVVEVLPPAACPTCGGAVGTERVAVQYQADLPPVRPHVTAFRRSTSTSAGAGGVGGAFTVGTGGRPRPPRVRPPPRSGRGRWRGRRGCTRRSACRSRRSP